MTVDDNKRDEKLRYVFNRETAKVSVLSSSKIDKYQYLSGKKYYLLVKVGKTKFTYSTLWKALEKQIKQLQSKEKKLKL